MFYIESKTDRNIVKMRQSYVIIQYGFFLGRRDEGLHFLLNVNSNLRIQVGLRDKI